MTEVLYGLAAPERERLAALRAEGRFFWIDVSLSSSSLLLLRSFGKVRFDCFNPLPSLELMAVLRQPLCS